MLYCTLITLFILLLVCLYIKLHHQTYFSIGIYLLSLYICSIAISFLEDSSEKIYTLEASFYFLISLLLFLIPILRFNPQKIERIKLYNENVFRYICHVFIIGGICSYIYFLPIVYKLFTSGISLLTLRTDMVGGEVYFKINIFYYFCTFICQFYPIILVFYFFSITNLQYSKFYNNLLLFSSTAYIINVLASIGRDGFVLWSMSYIFAFILFYNYLSHEQIKKQKLLFKRILLLFMLFFIPITLARFFMNGFKDGILSVFSYFGQQFGNFNNIYNRVNIDLIGVDVSDILPILVKKQNEINIITEQRSFYDLFGVDKFVFATFIASFYLGIGPLLTLIWGGVHAILNSLLIKVRKVISLGTVLYLTLLAQLPLHGIFYYKLGYTISNLYVICVILLSVFFSYNIRWNRHY